MSYEKTIWNTGDIITAEKMNHIEEGIAEASESGSGSGESSLFPLTITITSNSNGALLSTQLDKTYGEILTALKNGMTVAMVSSITKDENGNVVSENNNIFDIVTAVTIDKEINMINGSDSIEYRPSLVTGGGINYSCAGLFESVELALSAYPIIMGTATIDPGSDSGTMF